MTAAAALWRRHGCESDSGGEDERGARIIANAAALTRPSTATPAAAVAAAESVVTRCACADAPAVVRTRARERTKPVAMIADASRRLGRRAGAHMACKRARAHAPSSSPSSTNGISESVQFVLSPTTRKASARVKKIATSDGEALDPITSSPSRSSPAVASEESPRPGNRVASAAERNSSPRVEEPKICDTSGGGATAAAVATSAAAATSAVAAVEREFGA